jgi:hypothetical protein
MVKAPQVGFKKGHVPYAASTLGSEGTVSDLLGTFIFALKYFMNSKSGFAQFIL